jgi:recombinational DNA repair protein (RecF pathway)
MTMIRPATIVMAVTLLLNACATTQRTDLYFGRSIPGGGMVSEAQWKSFSDSVVSPRFPEGYTASEATGKWMDTDIHTTITEPTMVLTFIGKKSKTRQSNLDTIIQVYRRQFQQQAVLRLDTKAQVKFVGLP